MTHHTTRSACPPGHCTPATAIALGLALASAAATVAFAATPLRAPLPAPLQALEKKQGLSVVGTFPTPGGVTAYAAHMGTEPVALYLTADGKHVIAGTLFDAGGKNLTTDALAKMLDKPIADAVWG